MTRATPRTGTRTKLDASIANFLKDHDTLWLGGDEDFHAERRKHLEVFGFSNIPNEKQHSIGEVEFTAIRGPHGTIPVHVFYPSSGERRSIKEKQVHSSTSMAEDILLAV